MDITSADISFWKVPTKKQLLTVNYVIGYAMQTDDTYWTLNVVKHINITGSLVNGKYGILKMKLGNKEFSCQITVHMSNCYKTSEVCQ